MQSAGTCCAPHLAADQNVEPTLTSARSREKFERTMRRTRAMRRSADPGSAGTITMTRPKSAGNGREVKTGRLRYNDGRIPCTDCRHLNGRERSRRRRLDVRLAKVRAQPVRLEGSRNTRLILWHSTNRIDSSAHSRVGGDVGLNWRRGCLLRRVYAVSSNRSG